jgi:hypothetical protein
VGRTKEVISYSSSGISISHSAMVDTYTITFLLLCLRLSQISAFQTPANQYHRSSVCVASLAKEDTIDELFTFGDDDDDDDDRTLGNIAEKKLGPGAQRWANLNPSIKARIVQEGQERAKRNKKKREPKDVKKRRELLHV